MNKKTPEYYETMSFSNLVKAIDQQWSHTYVDYSEDCPDTTVEMEEIFDAIAEMQGDFDTPT